MASETNTVLSMPVLASEAWQMSYGERAALEGLLAEIEPRLAVEIGTAQGGSLQRIAARSREVHSFDLVPPPEQVSQLENVTFHTGDSHELLGAFLRQVSAEGRCIDFVLIDGDHTADGVRRDIHDVLGSDAVSNTIIVLHDTLNPEVRSGIEAARIAEHPKVTLYELDLVPGYLARREPYRLQMWGGLGLIAVDERGQRVRPVRDDRFHQLFRVLAPTIAVMRDLEARGVDLREFGGEELDAALRDALRGRDGQASDDDAQARLAELEAQRDDLAARLHAIESSRGWRLVVTLRELRDVLRPRSRPT